MVGKPRRKLPLERWPDILNRVFMDPSHRITFSPANGTPAQVFLVRMVCTTFPRRMWHDAAAVTIGECWTWHHPEGLIDSQNGWNCSGLPTPGCVAGEVVIEPLKKGWEPTAAQWSYSRLINQ